MIIGGDSGCLYVIDGSNGYLIWESMPTGIPIRSSPLIGDVDGDESLDILFMNIHQDIYKLNTNARVFKNSIYWSQLFGNSAKQAVAIHKGPDAITYNIILLLLFLLIVFIITSMFLSLKSRKARMLRSFQSYHV